MSKEKPTGWVAICRCGKAVGAIDARRTASEDASRILGEWLLRGDKVIPRFGHAWSQRMEYGVCDDKVQATDLKHHFPEIADTAALEELVEYSTIERLLYILHNYIDESGDADKKDATVLRTAIEKKALRLENELKELKATKRTQMDIAAIQEMAFELADRACCGLYNQADINEFVQEWRRDHNA